MHETIMKSINFPGAFVLFVSADSNAKEANVNVESDTEDDDEEKKQAAPKNKKFDTLLFVYLLICQCSKLDAVSSYL